LGIRTCKVSDANVNYKLDDLDHRQLLLPLRRDHESAWAGFGPKTDVYPDLSTASRCVIIVIYGKLKIQRACGARNLLTH
jgi:hypothetical protein